MENIRRRIKIFWLDHRDPILFYSIVIGVVIIIVQILNELTIYNNAIKKEQLNTDSVTEEQHYKYRREDEILIETFIEYCKDKNIEGAYSLISSNCKNNIYPTINDFKEKYYNNRFDKKRTIEIEYQPEEYLFFVSFYPDILEAGKYIDNQSVVDYFEVEQEVLDRKINIKNK